MNGTDIFSADNETFIEIGTQLNHTRNATLDFVTPMNVWVLFQPDPTLGDISQFKAEVGMREFNRTVEEEDDDDDEDAQVVSLEVITPSKILTMNEQIIIASFIIGLVIYCCKMRFCFDSWETTEIPFDRHRKVVSTDVEEAELHVPEDDEEDILDRMASMRGQVKNITDQGLTERKNMPHNIKKGASKGFDHEDGLDAFEEKQEFNETPSQSRIRSEKFGEQYELDTIGAKTTADKKPFISATENVIQQHQIEHQLQEA